MLSLVNLPRFSIVTPSFNQAQYLEATIKSVLSQGYPKLEYFVFDGGSTDGSIDILKRYADRLTYWESEPDRGQTDAIAKGFRRATGDLMNWLNSDDLLAPGALYTIARLYQRNPRASLYAAAVENFSGDLLSGRINKVIPEHIDLPSLLLASGRSPKRHQPGIFFTRKAYETVGGINPSYHFCMDLDLHGRLLETSANVVYDGTTVAYFRLHPAAKTRKVDSVAATVREYVEVTDAIGRRSQVSPGHHLHLRTLLGGVMIALKTKRPHIAIPCLIQAASICGRVLKAALQSIWKKVIG